MTEKLLTLTCCINTKQNKHLVYHFNHLVQFETQSQKKKKFSSFLFACFLQFFWVYFRPKMSFRNKIRLWNSLGPDQAQCFVKGYQQATFNSFLLSSNFCCLLITFANSLDPGQDQQKDRTSVLI